MFYICNVKMLARKNRERRNDQGRKEFTSHYPQVMRNHECNKSILSKRLTGVENMTSDIVVRE